MRKLRISIFDDDPTNLKLFAAIMSARNYEVYTFDQAVVCPVYNAQAVECSRLKPCTDIILTDNQMPRMTGIEMLVEQAQRCCRIDSRNKAITSADFDRDQRKIVEGLGCAVFEKPFRLHDLIAWLDDCERRIDLSKPLGIIRQGDRYPADSEMMYAMDADETIYKGTTMNFSECGLCLRTHAPLREEQSVMFKSDLPNGYRKASVRWVNKTEGDSCLAGFSCR